MTRKEWTRADGKNVEVHIKKRKQEVHAIMRMKAEALKAMTRNREGMILTGAQEVQIMVHIQAEAPIPLEHSFASRGVSWSVHMGLILSFITCLL